MDVRHLGAASWLVLREKLLKAILCPCRRPVQQWEQVVFGEGSSVCVCVLGGRGSLENQNASLCLETCKCVFRLQVTLLYMGAVHLRDCMLSGILTTRHSQQLKSLLCFCCFWSQLKVNGQVFGIDEQCVLGHSTTSQSLLAVGTVTGLSSFRCRRCVLFLYSHTD